MPSAPLSWGTNECSPPSSCGRATSSFPPRGSSRPPPLYHGRVASPFPLSWGPSRSPLFPSCGAQPSPLSRANRRGGDRVSHGVRVLAGRRRTMRRNRAEGGVPAAGADTRRLCRGRERRSHPLHRATCHRRPRRGGEWRSCPPHRATRRQRPRRGGERRSRPPHRAKRRRRPRRVPAPGGKRPRRRRCSRRRFGGECRQRGGTAANAASWRTMVAASSAGPTNNVGAGGTGSASMGIVVPRRLPK